MSTLVFLLTASALGASQLLEQVRIVDARGDHGVASLLIIDGRIASLNPTEWPEDTKVFDGRGRTVVPGLIDSHVHIAKTCGSAFLAPGVLPTEARQRHHLRSYLSLGVTTVVDPGISASDAAHMLELASTQASPELLFIGPLIGPRDGYPSVIFPDLEGVASPEDVRRLFTGFDSVPSRGVKVTMENGQLEEVWPLHSPAVEATIVEEARTRGRDVYVHAMDAEMARRGLRLEPHAFVHAPQQPDASLAAELARRGTYVMPTLAIVGGLRLFETLSALDERWIQDAVLADEIDVNRRPDVPRKMADFGAEIYAPSVPSFLYGLFSWGMWYSVPGRIEDALAATRQLHEAGVPLVVGSDAGGSPVASYLMHGVTTHLELELLVEAGLTPLEALTAATLTPAKMLHMEDELGTIEVGHRADLVVVEGDPLRDVHTLRTPVWVARAGEVRTPAEWLITATAQRSR